MTDGPAHGTILLVEDEEGVRSVLHELLAGLGYTVLEAGNGVEAVGSPPATSAPSISSSPTW